jgi:hypothetical protein
MLRELHSTIWISLYITNSTIHECFLYNPDCFHCNQGVDMWIKNLVFMIYG